MTTRWQSSPSYLAICSWLSNDIISVYWIWMWEIRQESFALGLNVFDLKNDFHGQRCFFFLFSVIPTPSVQRLFTWTPDYMDPPRSARRTLTWLWGLQQTGKCTNECLRVLCFWNHSQVRNFQMPPISQALLSQLREYLLKTFSFSWQTAM